MTAESFNAWLADMKSAGIARSDAECARLLGVHVNSILLYKKRGGSTTLALACSALMEGLPPFNI